MCLHAGGEGAELWVAGSILLVAFPNFGLRQSVHVGISMLKIPWCDESRLKRVLRRWNIEASGQGEDRTIIHWVYDDKKCFRVHFPPETWTWIQQSKKQDTHFNNTLMNIMKRSFSAVSSSTKMSPLSPATGRERESTCDISVMLFSEEDEELSGCICVVCWGRKFYGKYLLPGQVRLSRRLMIIFFNLGWEW